MTNGSVEQLELLREELTSDVMLCTTRDQHIRLVQRIARLDLALEQMHPAAPAIV